MKAWRLGVPPLPLVYVLPLEDDWKAWSLLSSEWFN